MRKSGASDLDYFRFYNIVFLFVFPLKGLIFQTEVEPEEKFFQGGLEKFWKQVSFSPT